MQRLKHKIPAKPDAPRLTAHFFGCPMIASGIWLVLALPPGSHVVVPFVIVCAVARMIALAQSAAPRY